MKSETFTSEAFAFTQRVLVSVMLPVLYWWVDNYRGKGRTGDTVISLFNDTAAVFAQYF